MTDVNEVAQGVSDAQYAVDIKTGLEPLLNEVCRLINKAKVERNIVISFQLGNDAFGRMAVVSFGAMKTL